MNLIMSRPMTLESLFLHLKDNKRGRVTVDVVTWALFLFLLQLVPLEIIWFIVRERKLIMIVRVGVIVLVMKIYRVICLLKIMSLFMHEDPGTNSHSLSPNA